jgi:molybdenum cofactor cytidylyltransferase
MMPEAGKIAGVILTAGFSTRARAFKPLLPFGATTVIEAAIGSLKAGGVPDIIVVTGFKAEALRPVLAHCGVREVVNPHPELGMFSSVLTGAAAVNDDVHGVLILPGDMPMVQSSTIRSLIDDYFESGADVIYPTFRGRRGHPPIISLRCLTGNLPPQLPGGLRTLLQAFGATTRELPVPDEGILIDIDTQDEYRRLLARQGQTPAES